MVPVRNGGMSLHELLITDDDRESQAVLDDVFSLMDCRMVFASKGTEALSIVRTRRIDLAILDYHLPDMSGLDLFRRIREELQTAVTCILISGHLTEAIRKEAFRLGVFEVYEKPLNLEMIRAGTRQALFRRSSRVVPVETHLVSPRAEGESRGSARLWRSGDRETS